MPKAKAFVHAGFSPSNEIRECTGTRTEAPQYIIVRYPFRDG